MFNYFILLGEEIYNRRLNFFIWLQKMSFLPINEGDTYDVLDYCKEQLGVDVEQSLNTSQHPLGGSNWRSVWEGAHQSLSLFSQPSSFYSQLESYSNEEIDNEAIVEDEEDGEGGINNLKSSPKRSIKKTSKNRFEVKSVLRSNSLKNKSTMNDTQDVSGPKSDTKGELRPNSSPSVQMFENDENSNIQAQLQNDDVLSIIHQLPKAKQQSLLHLLQDLQDDLSVSDPPAENPSSSSESDIQIDVAHPPTQLRPILLKVSTINVQIIIKPH